MSELTPFAGLELLAPADLLSTDNFRFQSVNSALIDRLLKIGAVTHKHDARAALADPTEAPTLAVSHTGGSIPAGLTLYVAYTYIDKDGGETLANVGEIFTGEPDPDPAKGPSAAVDYAAGLLLASNFTYGVTVTDGAGGETALSPTTSVLVLPGFANAEVKLGELKKVTEEVLGKPGEWRLWRSQAGGPYDLLATGTAETYTDKGEASPDCNVSPPEESTIKGTNKITVKVSQKGEVGWLPEFFRIYISTEATFVSPSLVAQYPEGEFGKTITISALELNPGIPPLVTTAYPHAQKIDPDTDLIEWHWKRPVKNVGELPALKNEEGDVRLVINDIQLYMWSGTEWVKLGGSIQSEGPTFAIPGKVSVGTIRGRFIHPYPGGDEQFLYAANVEIGKGEITFSVLKNGEPVPFLEKIKIKAGETFEEQNTPGLELLGGDKIDLDIEAEAGAPEGLALSVFIAHH